MTTPYRQPGDPNAYVTVPQLVLALRIWKLLGAVAFAMSLAAFSIAAFNPAKVTVIDAAPAVNGCKETSPPEGFRVECAPGQTIEIVKWGEGARMVCRCPKAGAGGGLP